MDANDRLRSGTLTADPFEDSVPMLAQAEWPKAVDLDGQEAVPEFPTHVLPQWLGEWASAVAQETQTPPDVPAMLGLAVLSAALAKRVVALPRQGWREPVNLYLAVLADSGERKSAVLSHALKPVTDYETEEGKRLADEIVRDEERRNALGGALKRAQEEAAAAKKADQRDKALDRVHELRMKLEEPPMRVPRLLADDVTQEGLVPLLAAHGERMAILAPEGTVFSVAGGRYTNGKPNLDLLVKCYSGEQHRVDRRGSAAEFLHEPLLTIGVCVQPGALEKLAADPMMREQGLLARFLFARPQSLVGWRAISAPPAPGYVLDTYATRMGGLLRLPGETHELRFAADALRELEAFERRIEPRLRPGEGDLSGGPMKSWGARLAGQVVRLSTLLHVAQEHREGQPWSGNVSKEAVQAAVAIADYLAPHARASFQLVASDELTEHAKKALAWIQGRLVKGDDTFTRTELHHALRTKKAMKTAAEVQNVIGLLEAHGAVRAIGERVQKRGGRPSPTWAINPNLRE